MGIYDGDIDPPAMDQAGTCPCCGDAKGTEPIVSHGVTDWLCGPCYDEQVPNLAADDYEETVRGAA